MGGSHRFNGGHLTPQPPNKKGFKNLLKERIQPTRAFVFN